MADSIKLTLAFEVIAKCFLSERDGAIVIELHMPPAAAESKELKRLIGNEPKVAAFTSIDFIEKKDEVVIFMTL